MRTLSWPYSTNNYYAKAIEDFQISKFFAMSKFIDNANTSTNENSIITTYNLSFTPNDLEAKNMYSKIFYIDLDEDYTFEETKARRTFTDPFISAENPYTIDVSCTIYDLSNDSYSGTTSYDASYFDKSRVYFSLGQNIPGVGGGIFTIGTDSTFTTNKKKPVIGLTTQDGCLKSYPTSDAMEIEDQKEYTFRLIYNPSAIREFKLLLFMKNVTDGGSFVLQSTGYGLSTFDNYLITKPRLYIYSSGWTNESGWNNSFDYALASFQQENSPIQVFDGVVYPIEYTIQQLSNVDYDEPSFTFEDPDLGYDETSNANEIYISSENDVVLYIQ